MQTKIDSISEGQWYRPGRRSWPTPARPGPASELAPWVGSLKAPVSARNPASGAGAAIPEAAASVARGVAALWAVIPTSAAICAALISPGLPLALALGMRGVTLLAGAMQRQNTKISKQIFPGKGISGPQSQFPHSCVCERFIYSHDWSPYSVGGNM
jgi:hypothetical protein